MARAVLDLPHFHDEAAAFAHVEALLWPNGPVCPHCGNADAAKIGSVKGRSKPSKKNPEGVERHGLRKCYAAKCRTTFTVRNGSIFADSHLPLHLWLQAIHMLTSAKKGFSTRHVQRLLNCSMKTAWFLTHRIREIMKPGTATDVPPMGGLGVTIEADETYIGAIAGRKKGRPPVEKHIVMTLVERDGIARSTTVPNVRANTLRAVLAKTAKRGTKIMTDDASAYRDKHSPFASHDRVAHAYGEYVRGDVHTNTVEGFFSILKRGLFGTYQHVSEHHLHRYLNEFDYRYNYRERLGVDDKTRAKLAVQNAKGRRLTYERLG
ncbi:MAG: IS1595 family transposase [bacterium]|nr:IS1595 family transposase [bacterium]